MYKKSLLSVLVLCMLTWSASAAPKLLRITGGNIRINVSVARDMIPIDVYWHGRPVMTGAVGSILSYAEKKPGFVGLGRKHNNQKEILESFSVKIDGKSVDWRKADKLSGKTAECVRVSKLRDVRVTYRIRLEGNSMTEDVSYTSSKDIKLQNYYHYHRWNKRLNQYASYNHKNVMTLGKFTKSKKIMYYGSSVTFCICDPLTEDSAVVTYTRSDKGVPTRFIQDDWNGALECFVDSQNRSIASGSTRSFCIKTDFVKSGSAQNAIGKIQKSAK